MSRIDDIFRHAELSEKSIEHYLVIRVEKEMGGKALKYYNANSTGYPDRMIILPGGVLFWVETKTKGQKVRKLQAHRHEVLRSLGQVVYVCDSIESVDEVLDKYTEPALQ